MSQMSGSPPRALCNAVERHLFGLGPSFLVILGSRVSLRQAGSLLREIKLSPDFFLVILSEPEMAEAVPSSGTHTTENFPVVEADSEFPDAKTGSMNRTLPTP